eukprot:TRINITY_DN135_c0_g1_i2.p3 TRINITY_DN135_c0_g1~~TRINITY_DN135_c0_g1_i2.p3  ORF type:complete len:187 (+),score=71.70 TRINITY_DN135_c0_g1_i2:227-787(+)
MSKNLQCVWAQRDDLVYFTIQQCDLKDEKVDIDFEAGKINFQSGEYALELEFFAPLKKEGSVWNNTGREVQLLLMKAEPGWWDRLTKDTVKRKNIKTDFNKWKDEDEQDEDTTGPGSFAGADGGGMDFGSMMGGGGGMPGMEGMDMAKMMEQMGGMGGMGGMDGMPGGEPDSDDEELPDLEEANEE